MYTSAELKSFLFLDIETASAVASYEELSSEFQALWDKKHETLSRSLPEEMTPAESYIEKAAIFAEFGRIICISCSVLKFDSGAEGEGIIKTFFDLDEKKMLAEFRDMAQKFSAEKRTSSPMFRFCGHNIKEFDLPYICRRMAANGLLPLKEPFLTYGKKPWEINHADTMEMWKFGDIKAYTRLELLAAVLGVESPKGDLDGSKVGRCFHLEKDYERIIRYCEADVRTTVNVVMLLSGLPKISAFTVRTT